MKPQSRAPPSRVCAITGPSTVNAPAWTALTNANWSTITQSQVRVRNSRQPVPSSARKLDPSILRFAGSRIAPMKSAPRPKVAASIAIAVPGPKPATSSPPSAAPPIDEALRTSRSRAFAVCSSAGGTVWGTIP